MREAVLIATLGAEPQVVTLTLDKLIQRGTTISRVEVVHTLGDTDPIRLSLKKLNEEFVAKRFYGNEVLFVPQVVVGRKGCLKDVSSAEEIEEYFQFLYGHIRRHKLAGRTIHLSIAGGRKPMAVFATVVAQILFDHDDRLWHLSSSPEFQRSRQMHSLDPHAVKLIAVPLPSIEYPESDMQRRRAANFLMNTLTDAEREVALLLLKEGLPNSVIAQRLGKSPKTVANQLTSIYGKLTQSFGLSEVPDRSTFLSLLARYT